MYDERFDRLKKSISKGERLSGLYVFVCAKDRFVPLQYLNAIVSRDCVSEEHHDSIEGLCDTLSGDAFGYSAEVNVVAIDKASMTKKQYETLSSSDSMCLIVCDAFEFDYTPSEEETQHVYEFEKLDKWMLSDYVRCLCKGFSEEDAQTLCDACEYEPFLVSNEAKKLSFIDDDKQSKVLSDMISLGQIGRKTEITPFKFINSIVKNDRQSTLHSMQEYVDNIKKGDVFGFVSLLKGNFKDVASLQMDSTATAEKLGISDKKFAALRYSKNRYSDRALVDILTNLTDIDYLVKTGRLDMNDERMVDYIVCTTMGR